ncbi:hypothetical protein J6590_072549 [Homalodisca vitripennis]|nr:hypothetical protein J6590_072549 [Homalodisca vitripennis]
MMFRPLLFESQQNIEDDSISVQSNEAASNDSYPKEIINLEMEKPTVEKAPVSLTTLSEDQPKLDQASDVFVVPGNLTYSEALK